MPTNLSAFSSDAEEIRRCLTQYDVPEKDVAMVISKLAHAYAQFKAASASAYVLEQKLKEKMDRQELADFLRFNSPDGYAARVNAYIQGYQEGPTEKNKRERNNF